MAVHRYLRAVGFSNIEKREQLKELIGEVVTKTVLQETRPEMEQNIKEIGRYATKNFVADQEDHLYAELCLDFAKDAGTVSQYGSTLTGQYYEYLVAASSAGGHTFNRILIDGDWVIYDANPPHA